jgi:propanediol dehydratase small subunit
VTKLDPAVDFPLAQKRKDLVKSPLGKELDDLTLDAVMSGKVTFDDLRISPEVLELQAQIAEGVGRIWIAQNFRRAAELTKVSDERLLEIYNLLRPYRCTKEEMLAIADELDDKYEAKVNAAFVRETADVYEQRGILKRELKG